LGLSMTELILSRVIGVCKRLQPLVTSYPRIPSVPSGVLTS
jgi:hypothetical protein